MSDDPIRDASDIIEPRVHADSNSRAAARNGIRSARGVRRDIIDWLQAHPTETLTCEETHHFHPHGKHQATSAALNALWANGILVRCGRRPNSEKNKEYEYDLSPVARSILGMPPGRDAMPGTEPVPPAAPRPPKDPAPPAPKAETEPTGPMPRPTRVTLWACAKCGGKPGSDVESAFVDSGYGTAFCPTCSPLQTGKAKGRPVPFRSQGSTLGL